MEPEEGNARLNHSNISLDRAIDLVKGSLKALNGSVLEPEARPLQEFSLMEEEQNLNGQKNKSWTSLLVITGAATMVGSCIPVGYNIGVINTPQTIIKEFCNASISERYGIELSTIELNVIWSTIVSIYLIGGMAGSLSGSWLADRWGRKGTILTNHILGGIAAVLFLLAPSTSSVELLLIARFFVGLSSGLTTSAVPMYLTEVAPLSLRGTMGTLCPLGITVGVLISQVLGLHAVLGSPTLWHYLLALYAVPILLSAIILPFLPESPKYLYIILKEEEKGTKELLRLRGVSVKQLAEEMQAIKASSKVELEAGRWSISRLITNSSLRWPLILVCALQAGQQFSGINAVFYYSVPIFRSAGLSEEGSQYASIGAGIVNLMVAILAVFIVGRCGRRKMILFSCATAIVCLLLLTIAISYIESVKWMPYFSIVMVLVYVFFYGVGLGPIPYFIGSELFSLGPRPAGMALGSMANWGGNFIVGMTFPSLQEIIGPMSFVPFILLTAALGILLWFRLPETFGLNPVEPVQAKNKTCDDNDTVEENDPLSS